MNSSSCGVTGREKIIGQLVGQRQIVTGVVHTLSREKDKQNDIISQQTNTRTDVKERDLGIWSHAVMDILVRVDGVRLGGAVAGQSACKNNMSNGQKKQLRNYLTDTIHSKKHNKLNTINRSPATCVPCP
jgi:hypothetical protein